MSSSDRPSVDLARRRALRIGALAPALLLGGCLRPLYAPIGDGGPELIDAMAAVDVPLIEGRVGQQVRNRLLFGLTGGSGALPAQFVLHVNVASSLTQPVVETYSGRPNIETVVLTGGFRLTPIGAPAPVFAGEVIARKSYDRTLQRFAAIRAARDAENRAAEFFADQIKTRVAAFLSQTR